MVTKFHYTIAMMAALFMLSSLSATVALPVVGRFIDRALLIEYAALMLVFLSYAIVDNHYLAGGLYVVDSIIFSFAIALTTYFKKTVRSNEVSTAILSIISRQYFCHSYWEWWMSGYQWVFVTGAIIALLSFLISLTIDTRLHQRINGVTELQKEVA